MSMTLMHIPPPARKKDYIGKTLLLGEPLPSGFVRAPLVRIAQRKNAMGTINTQRDVSSWGSIRVLQVTYRCEHCGAHHWGYIPESWIDEGKAVFVEEIQGVA